MLCSKSPRKPRINGNIGCPKCEEGALGPLCSKHACPECVAGAGGPMCPKHARKRVKAAVNAISFTTQSAKRAEESRLLSACPKCDPSGAGALCSVHEEQRLAVVCPKCEEGGLGIQCELHRLPICLPCQPEPQHEVKSQNSRWQAARTKLRAFMTFNSGVKVLPLPVPTPVTSSIGNR